MITLLKLRLKTVLVLVSVIVFKSCLKVKKCQNVLSLQLKIEGIRGSSYRGDIAIDDISVADGYCGGVVPPTPGPTGL